MATKTFRTILTLLILVCIYSCSVGKFIPEGETLYTGSKIDVTFDKEVKNQKKVRQELNTLVAPEPNTQFLGLRPGLYFYYKAQKKRPGFINRWLNKKIGEEPVYLSDVNQQRVKQLMLNRLDNRGFFYSKVTSEVDSTQKHAAIKYNLTLPKPYTLEKFELEKDSLPIYSEIEKALEETEIKLGDRFDLELMKFERERIDHELKQRGYYNFNPDFLIFEADTNRYDNKKYDLFLRLKRNLPKKTVIAYTIDSISVYPNFSIDTEKEIDTNTTVVNGINFIQEKEFFKPKKMEPYILFGVYQKYNSETARLTSNRLSALGNYKYVNIRFNVKDSTELDSTASLYADILLSPLTKRSVRAQLQAVTKSNGFAGPGISLTYNNRNLFKGGETLSISGNFAYETQLSGGKGTGLSSIAGGLKTDLVIPRLLPFSPKQFKYAVPKTKISLGTDFLKRTKLYTLNSFNTSFGYTWNANRFVYHELNPISINYVNLSNTTEEFTAILDKNPFLKQSFDQQFIAGLNYTFTYNELVDVNNNHPIFISTSLDIAGNTLNLIGGSDKTVFGLEYAQYAKADIDFRYYIKWGKEQSLVSRLYAGWGIPYGNSSTLPFVKQFFSGGPYSVRAFKIRSLGPGTFSSTENGTSSFFDQSGNLRLEGNLEYRFPIWSYLKGAVFADAGNVWLTYDIEIPEDEPAASREFNEELLAKGKYSSNWAKELGIGVGLGLRVDIQSFVLRFDFASPLQLPYLPEGERIRIPFFDGGSNNVIFNFAIGYPF
ncbi:BamA/TamA family outer membrane protein [Arenibacter sp. BSSL-BM3]|uniref:BamA/TamA family outer membrane protein n=1 Tax=Arenibacter arenosicollis TaxID=2762274 RepID=A0ABR7QKX5_9FLAO|nr:BamA/TamA family outer membrane protein [Arenibacter arenosicollis]MBC8767759.1 BamA/TamA family outer membrane protein [Arenibacter arenosicollis]